MPNVIQRFQQHIIDTIDFHRNTEGLSYASIVGVLEIVKRDLLEELAEDEEEDYATPP